jgi:hypothetical protein
MAYPRNKHRRYHRHHDSNAWYIALAILSTAIFLVLAIVAS